MLVRDIDRKLDMACTVAITQDSGWFKMASRSPHRTPARIYSYPDGSYVQMYFGKESLPKQLESAIKANQNMEEKESYYSVNEKFSETLSGNFISEVMAIPSVIISESYILGSEFFITFRFHRSLLRHVNAAVGRAAVNEDTFRVVYIGRSEGITAILNRTSANNPLTVVRFRFATGEDFNISNLNPMDFPDTISEADRTRIVEGGARVITYSDTDLKWASRITGDDNLYELSVNDEFLNSLGKKSFQSMIPLITFFGRRRRDSLEITTLIPSAEVNDFLDVLYSLSDSMPERGMVLQICAPLEEGMWGWL